MITQLHKRFRISYLTVLVLAFFLVACRSQGNWIPERYIPKLPYKVAGSSDPKIIEYPIKLEKYGVKVITEGQDYLISIPSPLLFPNESPRLTWQSYALLNEVACYLKLFRKISVQVNAFSNPCVSARRDKSLTLARARAVGNYLWSQGVDSRFIFTQGLGSDKPIVAMKRKGDAFPSSRIEITFRDMVA